MFDLVGVDYNMYKYPAGKYFTAVSCIIVVHRVQRGIDRLYIRLQQYLLLSVWLHMI